MGPDGVGEQSLLPERPDTIDADEFEQGIGRNRLDGCIGDRSYDVRSSGHVMPPFTASCARLWNEVLHASPNGSAGLPNERVLGTMPQYL